MKMNRLHLIYLPALVAALLCTACGTPGTSRKNENTPEFLKKIRGEPVIPRGANTIYIALAARDAKGSEAAVKLHQKLVSELTLAGRLAVSEKRDTSDLVAVIKITTYQVQITVHNSFGTPEKKRLLIRASCTLVEKKNSRPVFFSVPIQAFREYSGTTAPIETDAEAEDRVLEDLAGRLVSQIHQGWHTDRMSSIEKGRKR